MKKSISLIIVLAAIILSMIIPTKNVYAANKKITALDVTQVNGKVSISGTTEDGALAVAIAIYDETGAKLITMETTSVNSDNGYSDVISLEKGKYIIKVADYEGGAFLEKSFTVEASEEEKTENKVEDDQETEGSKANPKTGDNILVFVTLLIATTLGLSAIVLEKARRK